MKQNIVDKMSRVLDISKKAIWALGVREELIANGFSTSIVEKYLNLYSNNLVIP